MSTRSYAKRVDGNQAKIVDALRSIGVGVIDTSSAGCGVPDLLCFWRGQTILVEIKNGDRPPSARKLTAAQVWLHEAARVHGARIPIVETVDQALAVFGARVSLTAPERFAEDAA